MGGYSVTVVVVRGHRWLGRRKLVGVKFYLVCVLITTTVTTLRLGKKCVPLVRLSVETQITHPLPLPSREGNTQAGIATDRKN